MSDQRATARSARPVTAPAVPGARGDPMTGPGSRLTCSSTAVSGPTGPVVVLRVAGEVDLCTVDLLRSAVGAVVAQRPAHLVVDLAGLGFCSRCARHPAASGQCAGRGAAGRDRD